MKLSCSFFIIFLLNFISFAKFNTEKHMIPIANKQDYIFEIHGEKINDDYNWLRDPKWPDVDNSEILDYLKAENKYTEIFFADLQNEKEKIFEELKGRIKLDDVSTYIKKEDYYYYHKTESDKNYPIYCRKYKALEAEEEVILDVNALAKGYDFTNVTSIAISPDQNLMAYSVDFSGNEKYDIKIFDLKEQKYLPDIIKDVSPKIAWHEELQGFFYITINENLRPDKVMFHYLGNKQENDKLIFQVKNPLHFISIDKSVSKKYIFISSGNHNENEVYVISMQDHKLIPRLIREAQNNIFYDAEHKGDYFYIKTNLNAKNFRIVQVPINSFAENNWRQDYIKEDKVKYLKSFDITDSYLILNYRNQGLPLIKVKQFKEEKEKAIHFPDKSFQASSYSTNFDEDDIRVDYSSLARPKTTYSYDFNNNKLSILKQQEIPSGFNPDEYEVERIFADSENIRVPITLLYKKSLFKKDGLNPLYLSGYGSYGIATPVSFRNSAITLVDRGFVYAIAHIRGGDELGHDWYESAKFLNKKRTFQDFIACSEALISAKYTSKNNIAIMGGSAGGMLIGYVINERPELYKVAVAHVPFVDVLNTMLDKSLPLTPIEYREWGNPQEEEYFQYIKSYSPYDNIKSQDYPHIFVTCGISDPRVGYWEAAKWVAKLRTNKTDNNFILLKTNLDAGHQGASGRFDTLKEVAGDLTFIFKIFSISKLVSNKS